MITLFLSIVFVASSECALFCFIYLFACSLVCDVISSSGIISMRIEEYQVALL